MFQEGGGNCVKYLKNGVKQKRGEGKQKDFNKGGKLDQETGALKRGGGGGTPLQTIYIYIYMYVN